jgi:hypothetical protein
MNNIIVVYLISTYDDKQNLKKFINNYLEFSAGSDHELIICFKNFMSNDIIFKTPELNQIKYTKYIDNNDFNDYDWGSYQRISKYYINKIIFFMNCHSRPLVKNWLKLFEINYSKNSLLGSGGSFESMVNSAIKGNHTESKFKSIIYTISNFLDFPLFPNPHIRSNCFMISAKDFLELKLNNANKFNKKGTWINESGRNGMTNQLKKKKFNIYVINSDGKKFEERDWHLSETYALKNQSKLIISDKFSSIYSKLSIKEKKNFQNCIWEKF